MTEAIIGPGGREPSARLIALVEGALRVAARAWTLLPRRTPRGCVPGKTLVALVRTDTSAPFGPVGERTVMALTNGGLGRAGTGRFRNLSVEIDESLRAIDELGDRPSRLMLFRFDVQPGAEGTACELVRLHAWAFGLLFRRTRTRRVRVLAEPVPFMRLAAQAIPPGSADVITWHPELLRRLAAIPRPAATAAGPAILLLDSDVDERVVGQPVGYLGNCVLLGSASAAVDPRNDRGYREPGTHGTVVAALIALVNPAATLSVARVASADPSDGGGDGEFVLSGLHKARRARTRFAVVNVSSEDDRPFTDRLSGAFDRSMLEEAVEDLREQGTVVVAAAGNTRRENVGLPARLDQVIAVGATTWSGAVSSFSRSSDSKPELMAPGGERGSSGGTAEWIATFDGEEAIGTSFACALVTALASCVTEPDDDWNARRARILQMAAGSSTLLGPGPGHHPT